MEIGLHRRTLGKVKDRKPGTPYALGQFGRKSLQETNPALVKEWQTFLFSDKVTQPSPNRTVKVGGVDTPVYEMAKSRRMAAAQSGLLKPVESEKGKQHSVPGKMSTSSMIKFNTNHLLLNSNRLP